MHAGDLLPPFAIAAILIATARRPDIGPEQLDGGGQPQDFMGDAPHTISMSLKVAQYCSVANVSRRMRNTLD